MSTFIISNLWFYVLALSLIFFAFKVVTSANPIHSALYLVLTMMGVAGLFFHLNAQFIAGVQVIVYAGAVMVLFVMVLMLFDLKHEFNAFAKGLVSGFLKLMSVALVVGYLVGVFLESGESKGVKASLTTSGDQTSTQLQVTRDLAQLLYTKYVLVFEVLGVLLLVVAIGAVAISRIQGGTHAKH